MCLCILIYSNRHFLMSARRMREFHLADAEALSTKRNHIIMVMKDKMNTNDLVPELQTYKKMGFCIEVTKNKDETAARIRYY